MVLLKKMYLQLRYICLCQIIIRYSLMCYIRVRICKISVIESCTVISFEAEKKCWYDKLSNVHCRNLCASPYIIC